MTRATITVDRDFTLGAVPRRIFGSFVEHMGRCVYTGIYEPGHPTADDEGFREDVLQLVRELGPTVIRYPGGNFVSGYNWENGVGPVDQRPREFDSAWGSIETNAFGLHEFVSWSKKAGTEIMEAVNLGTRGADAARELVEYANFPGGTRLSDLRIANGAAEPFDIKLWCLGNEMDGPWQIGHKTADEYGRLAAEAARVMRFVDPSIELVASGSSNSAMPTFGSWEQTVLGHAYDEVDYISLHSYYSEEDGDAASFLASAVDMDYFIDSVVATADAIRASGRHSKFVNLSFDEWNIWYKRGVDTNVQPLLGANGEWELDPNLVDQTFNLTDAVVVGTMLNSLLRHGDRVKIANMAQLVNLLAPIRTNIGGAAWRQTIFWPFARMAEAARGEILRVAVRSDRYDSRKYGDTDVVDASATWDEEHNRAAFFLANRSMDETAEITLDLRGFRPGRVLRAEVLAAPEGGDRFSSNTKEAGEQVSIASLNGVSAEDDHLTLTLPKLSWGWVEVEVEAG